MMDRYIKFMAEMTDEKAIEYMYQNGYFDLKVADYISKRLNQLAQFENRGCEECYGVAGMEVPMANRIQKVNYCPICGRKLVGE